MRKTPIEEVVEEFERKTNNLRPLKDEVIQQSKKKLKAMVKKSILREQFAKRQEEKEKKKDPMGKMALEEKRIKKAKRNNPCLPRL